MTHAIKTLILWRGEGERNQLIIVEQWAGINSAVISLLTVLTPLTPDVCFLHQAVLTLSAWSLCRPPKLRTQSHKTVPHFRYQCQAGSPQVARSFWLGYNSELPTISFGSIICSGNSQNQENSLVTIADLL